MNLKAARAAALKAAQAIVDGAKGRDLTDDEHTAVAGHVAEIKSLDEKIAKAAETEAMMGSLKELGTPTVKDSVDELNDKVDSLGDYVIKMWGDKLASLHLRGARISAPEYKAPSTQVVTGWGAGIPVLTDYDKTVVQARRERLTIADLLGSGTISGNAISYFIEGAQQGGFATVAEGGAKPQISFDNPTAVVDTLRKIAGHIKLSDEFIEDIPFLKSEIDTRLLYALRLFEENQIYNGSGVGTNILGLRNRSGVQVQAAPATADGNADAIFQAMTKVSTATDLQADGLLMHPLDYQNFRLSKDGNGQYFGGGYFQGQYGNGTLLEQPNLWGLRTIVTTNVPLGEVMVGAFSQGATVYRKGGIRVEATNTHADDFTNSLVTVRAEERLALAVRYPAAFVKAALAA